MSDSLFSDLGIDPPDVNLGVGSGSHAMQTARVMVAFDEWLDANACRSGGHGGRRELVDGVHARRGQAEIPVAHVEAGLTRSIATMPEEINRIVVDGSADLAVHAVG